MLFIDFCKIIKEIVILIKYDEHTVSTLNLY